MNYSNFSHCRIRELKDEKYLLKPSKIISKPIKRFCEMNRTNVIWKIIKGIKKGIRYSNNRPAIRGRNQKENSIS
jgi:hypothetical protein